MEILSVKKHISKVLKALGRAQEGTYNLELCEKLKFRSECTELDISNIPSLYHSFDSTVLSMLYNVRSNLKAGFKQVYDDKKENL